MAEGGALLECVVNVSEGRDRRTIDRLGAVAADVLLDVHSDAEHHRSVLTLGGPAAAVERAVRDLTAVAVADIDLRGHVGVHPRLGTVDVVPFVPLDGLVPGGAGPDVARAARDRFATWAGTVLGLPCFLYGSERTLPDVRRQAFAGLLPDTGPARPDPTVGATAVGTRPVLVAYNVWLTGRERRAGGTDPAVVATARQIAAGLRSPAVRALGLAVGSGAQVSVNLVDTGGATLVDVYDAVAEESARQGVVVERAELVGLLPGAALAAVPPGRWSELDVGDDRTIEHRLAAVSSTAG